MRPYADDTEVPISRSRGQIDDLLREWGAAGVAWADSWEQGLVTLQFTWLHPKTTKRYVAKVQLRLRTDEQLRQLARHRQTGRIAEGKLEKLKAGRGRQEHRALLLWLKGAFNAVALGIITPEQIFLSWMQGADGRTVYEVVEPELDQVLAFGSAAFKALSPAGGSQGGPRG